MERRQAWLEAVIWAVFGTIVLIASWRMDRLEHQGINPWSIPGLMPGVVGVLIIVVAAALAWQARRAPAKDEVGAVPAAGSGTGFEVPGDAQAEAATDAAAEQGGPGAGPAARTAMAAVLCIVFAGLTLGRGWSFFLEGAIFIFLFITVFSWRDWRMKGRLGRGLVMTAVVALASSGAITWLFESVFLVRLP